MSLHTYDSTSTTIREQRGMEQFAYLSFCPDTCCTWCDKICQWIDPCIMGCATLLAVIAVATALFCALPHLAALCAAIACMTGYYTIQLCIDSRDEAIARSTETLRHTELGLEETNAKLEKESSEISQALAEAKLVIVVLQKTNHELSTSLSTIQTELANKDHSIDSLRATNVSLLKTSTEQAAHSAQLQKDIAALQKLVEADAGQKTALAQEVGALAKEETAFGTHVAVFKTTTREFSDLVDTQAKALAAQWAHANETTQNIISHYAAKQASLELTLSSLRKVDADLHEDRIALDRQLALLKQEIQQDRDTLVALERQRQETLEAIRRETVEAEEIRKVLNELRAEHDRTLANLTTAAAQIDHKKDELIAVEKAFTDQMQLFEQTKAKQLKVIEDKIQEKMALLTKIIQKIKENSTQGSPNNIRA